MTEHSIFYYPYASFKGEQELLLKAAALYFDKLYILDPSKVNWAGIGQSPLSYDSIENYIKLLPEDLAAHMKRAGSYHKYQSPRIQICQHLKQKNCQENITTWHQTGQKYDCCLR